MRPLASSQSAWRKNLPSGSVHDSVTSRRCASRAAAFARDVALELHDHAADHGARPGRDLHHELARLALAFDARLDLREEVALGGGDLGHAAVHVAQERADRGRAHFAAPSARAT